MTSAEGGFGAANDILNLRLAAGQSKLMPQLHRIAGDTVVPCHSTKAHTVPSAGAVDSIFALAHLEHPSASVKARAIAFLIVS